MRTFSVDISTGNQVSKHSCVWDRLNFPNYLDLDDWRAFLRGDEVEIEWDDDGEPVSWASISDDCELPSKEDELREIIAKAYDYIECSGEVVELAGLLGVDLNDSHWEDKLRLFD